MNKREAILFLEKKRDKAIGDMSFFGEGSRKGLMNEIRVNTYDIAINTLQQIDEPIDTLAQEYDVEPETIREWLDRGHAGSFEKLVVPDYVAEWYEKKKRDLEYSIWEYIYEWDDREDNDFKKWMNRSENNPIKTLIRMKDGYAIQPKRWVIKNTDGDTCYLKRFRIGDDCIDGESSGWIGERVWAFTFDDKSKAEAVATLVEGSVEEV